MVAEIDADVVRADGFTLAQMVAALESAGARFVTLLRSLSSAEGTNPAPNMTWTAAETAVHMLSIIRRGLGDTRRSDSLEGLGVLNDQTINEIDERDVAVIASLIEADLGRYTSILLAAPADKINDRIVDLHAGVRADIPSAISYQLFDLLGHGWDIATATGNPWSIDPGHAALDLQASLPALRPWVLDEVLNGPARRATFTFPEFDGALDVRTGSGTYSVRRAALQEDETNVDPVEMFLAVAGRVPGSHPQVRELASWFRPI